MKPSFLPIAVLIAILLNSSHVRGELIARSELESNNPNVAQNSLEERDRIIFTPRLEAKNDEPRGPVNPPPPFGESLCPVVKIPLTAIVPNQEGKTQTTLTARERPTFWFYIPYETPITAEFLLKQNDEEIDRRKFQLSGKAGIVGIDLPQNIQLSTLDENYDWVFTLICNPRDRSYDLYVGGSIRRVNPTPNLIPPPTATPQEKAKLYASDGLWNEGLTTVVRELYPLDPTTARLYFTDLLQQIGIENLAEEPIVE